MFRGTCTGLARYTVHMPIRDIGVVVVVLRIAALRHPLRDCLHLRHPERVERWRVPPARIQSERRVYLHAEEHWELWWSAIAWSADEVRWGIAGWDLQLHGRVQWWSPYV